MIIRSLTLCMLLAFSIGLTACSSDSTTSPSGAGSMSGKINGTSWSGSLVVSGTYTSGILAIAGQDDQVRQVQLRLINPAGAGTYQLGMGSVHAGTVTIGTGVNDSYAATMSGGSGTITVTELSSSRAKGTFSFTARNNAGNTASVTDGSFDVQLN